MLKPERKEAIFSTIRMSREMCETFGVLLQFSIFPTTSAIPILRAHELRFDTRVFEFSNRPGRSLMECQQCLQLAVIVVPIF